MKDDAELAYVVNFEDAQFSNEGVEPIGKDKIAKDLVANRAALIVFTV